MQHLLGAVSSVMQFGNHKCTKSVQMDTMVFYLRQTTSKVVMDQKKEPGLHIFPPNWLVVK